MPVQQTVTDVVTKLMNVTHKLMLQVSGGRLGKEVFGMPAVLVHTTGRKSGQRRSIMLTTPIHEPDRLVLVASKGGDDRHPDWYHNIVAHPDIEVTEDGVTHPMRARTATSEEKAELWPRIVDAYRGYADYQRRTERDIPVIICEPT